MTTFLLPSDFELFDRLDEPVVPRRMKRSVPEEFHNGTDEIASHKLEEFVIDAALKQAGLEKGRKEIVKAVFCFWKLGPGWHTYAALSHVYNEHWPLLHDGKKPDCGVRSNVKDPESRIRNNCKRLNDEAKRTGRGSQAGHNSDCKRTDTHGICQKRGSGLNGGGLYTLEPYLETIITQACSRFSITTPPSSPQNYIYTRRVQRTDQRTDFTDIKISYLSTQMESIRAELSKIIGSTLSAERHSKIQMETRIVELTALLDERKRSKDELAGKYAVLKESHDTMASKLQDLRTENDTLQKALDATREQRDMLRQALRKSEAASALTSLSRVGQ